ncbi:MAG TPA: transglutaminase-like domain-containing protein [Flavobacteriales bacterium]
MEILNTQMYNSEVNALISLIEDPDESIFNQVRNELKRYGEQIVPQLEQYWELQSLGPLFHARLSEIISSIQYDGVYNRLKEWNNSESKNLLEGALIINRYQYPGYDEEELRYQVSKIRQDIWLEINDNLTALEIVRVMNHMLFKHYGFYGDKENVNDPRLNFMADLLNTRCGNPLSLGLLYAHIAERLEIPIYPINLPSHFLLCYLDYHPDNKEFGMMPEDAEVLFYINPFNNGAILHREEIDLFLAKQNLPSEDCFFTPCSNSQVISRMLNNLIHSYISLNNDDKVRELKTLQSLLLEG